MIEVVGALGEQGTVVSGGSLGNHFDRDVLLEVLYNGLSETHKLVEVKIGLKFAFVRGTLVVKLHFEKQLFYFALHHQINKMTISIYH